MQSQSLAGANLMMARKPVCSVCRHHHHDNKDLHYKSASFLGDDLLTDGKIHRSVAKIK